MSFLCSPQLHALEPRAGPHPQVPRRYVVTSRVTSISHKRVLMTIRWGAFSYLLQFCPLQTAWQRLSPGFDSCVIGTGGCCIGAIYCNLRTAGHFFLFVVCLFDSERLTYLLVFHRGCELMWDCAVRLLKNKQINQYADECRSSLPLYRPARTARL